MSRYGRTEQERFWEKVEMIPFHECWEWTGARLVSGGYGAFRLSEPRKTVRAHRYAWETIVGDIPDGKILLHSCDNPGCVRPDHLSVGTIADNTADMMSKGRSRFSGTEPERCRRGHLVVGDNAKPSGYHASGRRRFRCRRCADAWSKRVREVVE